MQHLVPDYAHTALSHSEAQVMEMCFNDSLNRRSAHYSQPAKSSPPPGFVNKVQ